jgi:3-oxoacyl-[acyl-carrier protein] reductase
MAARVALVTGAARGIGAEVASRLARDGYAIAALDLRDCAETLDAVRAQGSEAVGYLADVSSWDDVDRAVTAVERGQGGIEVVASVAGVWQHVPFLELDPAAWHRILDVNLEGTFNVCRLAAEPMARRRRGAIVCVSSNAAFLAWEGGAHYSASKAGIVGLVKGMALELGPLGIRANAVCPGTIRTPATESELVDPAAAAVQTRACPLGRLGLPSDIAEAVAFLADRERAAWITGETLFVDGGFGTHGEGADFGAASDSVVG